MTDSGRFLCVPGRRGIELLFSMEPIVHRRDPSPFGYELLYRGSRPCAFRDIDAQLLAYLGTCPRSLPTLFVNLSNDIMSSACDDALLRAARNADVYFELSERAMAPGVFERIASRVEALSRQGVRFALDDFGSGHDGLSRLLAMDSVRVIKLDGALLERAARRPAAARMLRAVCDAWRDAGIRIVAECIESADRLQAAESLEVDLLQGHLLNAMVAAGEAACA
jgi:EAL domain-containing protein (putative c-di-GMP-specific phosphodiesterase class I)